MEKYDYQCSFYEGLAQVKLNGKWGFIDKQGNVVIPIKYDWADNFSDGLAHVKLTGKWGFIDKQNNVVVPFKYNWTTLFNNGLAHVKLNNKWGFVDKQGNWYNNEKEYQERSLKSLSILDLPHRLSFGSINYDLKTYYTAFDKFCISYIGCGYSHLISVVIESKKESDIVQDCAYYNTEEPFIYNANNLNDAINIIMQSIQKYNFIK